MAREKGPAPKPEQSPDSVHFLRPIDDLLELCFHMFAEVAQDGMFPAGKQVPARNLCLLPEW